MYNVACVVDEELVAAIDIELVVAPESVLPVVVDGESVVTVSVTVEVTAVLDTLASVVGVVVTEVSVDIEEVSLSVVDEGDAAAIDDVLESVKVLLEVEEAVVDDAR
ncbi:hypothetical protein HK101_006681 [Irineochytrium annulatum]|nr:hypothetical protein HK101_006681 [Irineochytrium annulatum]